ncbi:hypothetical protein B5S33_g3267 [[Candida] boidinii]|nr:hypothetical protein B5S33_g3267 [[Candida] boidinii]
MHIPSYLLKTHFGLDLQRLIGLIPNDYESNEENNKNISKQLSILGLLGNNLNICNFEDDYQEHLIKILKKNMNSHSFHSNRLHYNDDNHDDNDDNDNNANDSDDDKDIEKDSEKDYDTDDNGNDDDDENPKRNSLIDSTPERSITAALTSSRKSIKSVGVLPSSLTISSDSVFDISKNGLEFSTCTLHKSSTQSSYTSRQITKYFTTRANESAERSYGIYYYEIEVLCGLRSCDIIIGYMDNKKNSIDTSNLRGADEFTWSYSGKDGKLSHSENGRNNIVKYTVRFGVGDIVGCGVNFYNNSIFITLNGVYLGEMFKISKDVKSVIPLISMTEWNKTKINFGLNGNLNFTFDIDSYVETFKNKFLMDIDKTVLPSFQLNIDSNTNNTNNNTKNRKEKNSISKTLVKSLNEKGKKIKNDGNINITENDIPDIVNSFVLSYFNNMGYADCLKGLKLDIETERNALFSYNLNNTAKDNSETKEIKEEIDEEEKEFELILRRQELRRLISSGKILESIESLKENFSFVIDENPNIIFRLECLRLFDLIKNSALIIENEDYSNDQNDEIDKVFDYGKELKEKYSKNSKYSEYLNDISSLFAFPNPQDSPLSYLLDISEVERVIEDLNKIILSHYGYNKDSEIDTLIIKTEQRLNEIRKNNGGSLIDMLDDILQI